MPSSFTWLDYSARERKAMLTVVDLFREKGTVDELGLGRIRDAFADRLFPGTSTLQSRTRYWLFVPWLYLQLEREHVRSADADRQIRTLQAGLVRSLEKGGESEGVIGIEVRDRVLRPPSIVYWAGLSRYGILQFLGSIGRYHASLDAYYRGNGLRRSEGDEQELIDPGHRNWHAGLPPAPADLLDRSTFQLRRVDAEYLRERFVTVEDSSMLAWALQHPASLQGCDAPWQHPRLAEIPADLRVVVDQAEHFSTLMYGAVLVYNLAMAELAASRGHHEPLAVDEYRAGYREWVAKKVEPRLGELRTWDRGTLWTMVSRMLRGGGSGTREFSERWMRRVLEDPTTALDDPATRSLVATREREMKGQLARLHNPAALERWSGRSGVYQLTYRWGEARTILQDVATGLRADGEAT
jgi:hypothetical protein